jgi:hypothetical protein
MASIISAGTTSGTSLNLSGDTSGVLQLASNGSTTAVTINTSQGVAVLNCLGVGNATPSTSGAGITFPASQSASTDANTLDDYEEGTFTPVYQPASGSFSSITYTEQFGAYTKIGNRVYVQGRIRSNSISVGTASGGVRIGGLPFTVQNNSTTSRNAGCLSVVTAWGGDFPSGIFAESNSTFMPLLYRTSVNGATIDLDVTDMGTGGNSNNVFYSACYIVD